MKEKLIKIRNDIFFSLTSKEWDDNEDTDFHIQIINDINYDKEISYPELEIIYQSFLYHCEDFKCIMKNIWKRKPLLIEAGINDIFNYEENELINTIYNELLGNWMIGIIAGYDDYYQDLLELNQGHRRFLLDEDDINKRDFLNKNSITIDMNNILKQSLDTEGYLKKFKLKNHLYNSDKQRFEISYDRIYPEIEISGEKKELFYDNSLDPFIGADNLPPSLDFVLKNEVKIWLGGIPFSFNKKDFFYQYAKTLTLSEQDILLDRLNLSKSIKQNLKKEIYHNGFFRESGDTREILHHIYKNKLDQKMKREDGISASEFINTIGISKNDFNDIMRCPEIYSVIKYNRNIDKVQWIKKSPHL